MTELPDYPTMCRNILDAITFADELRAEADKHFDEAIASGQETVNRSVRDALFTAGEISGIHKAMRIILGLNPDL